MKDQSILPEENIILESGCLSKEDVIACAVGLVLRNCSEMEKEKLEQEKLRKERKSRNGMGRTAPRKAAKNEPRFEEVPRQRTRKKPRARAK